MVSSLLNAAGSARARAAICAVVLGGLASGCATLPPAPTASPSLAQPQPAGGRIGANANGPRYKVGAPYQSGGVWYVPAEQPDYDEVGLASWYGDAFNGKPTANGEVFDMNALSAAHATLPMPCLVEVTNLDNGRKLVLRMNDRGPFHPGRIIDLSHAAAERLGYAGKGTTRVRVRYAGPASLDGAAPTTVAANTAPVAPTPRPLPTYQIAAPKPPVAANTAAGAGVWVQAGAFSTRTAAEHAAARLATTGQIDIRPVQRGGATLYRVLVRSSAPSAEQARARVVELGFNDARIATGL